VTEVANRC